ncbi:unnamed protein product, partial [Ascophyllum nodosum]
SAVGADVCGATISGRHGGHTTQHAVQSGGGGGGGGHLVGESQEPEANLGARRRTRSSPRPAGLPPS